MSKNSPKQNYNQLMEWLKVKGGKLTPRVKQVTKYNNEG